MVYSRIGQSCGPAISSKQLSAPSSVSKAFSARPSGWAQNSASVDSTTAREGDASAWGGNPRMTLGFDRRAAQRRNTFSAYWDQTSKNVTPPGGLESRFHSRPRRPLRAAARAVDSRATAWRTRLLPAARHEQLLHLSPARAHQISSRGVQLTLGAATVGSWTRRRVAARCATACPCSNQRYRGPARKRMRLERSYRALGIGEAWSEPGLSS